MGQQLVLSERKFFQTIRRTLSIHWTTPPIQSNFNFCTQAADNSCEESSAEEEGVPKSLCLRIEGLQKGESVGSAFQSWMGDGFPIHRGDIFHTINRLRKRKSNKIALEVSLTLMILLVIFACNVIVNMSERKCEMGL